MFIITLKNLRASTLLGVYDWEREAKWQVTLTIVLHVDDTAAGASDAIGDAVDYDRIERGVVDRLASRSYNLLERLAMDVAAFILSLDARIATVSLEVDKPSVMRQSDSVSVSVTLRQPR